MTSRPLRAIAACAALAAASCTAGPDYHTPVTPIPPIWGPPRTDAGGVVVGGAVDPRWWNSFGDPELGSLVDRLARQNLDLQEAAERIQQGRAQVTIARSQGLPQIDYTPRYTLNRQSPNGFLELVTPEPGAPLQYDIYENTLSPSWELDLFGRVRRQVEAERADTEAEFEARNELALSAISDLAADYMRLRGTEAREAITRRNLQLIRRSADLVRTQRANGVATVLDTAQADAEVASVAATLPAYRTQEAALINAIGLLLALPPRALEAELSVAAPIPVTPLAVPIGLPGDLVRRRPDIRRAEAELHQATAQTGVAVANFYPEVTLSGTLSLEGLKPGNAFSLPDRAFAIGPVLDLPLFKGGRLEGELRLRKSEQRAALLAFRQTVLQAWTDVDNALTAYTEARAARAETERAFGADARAANAANQQFVQGQVDFLNVISAQNALLQVESALAESDTEIDTDLVALYRALGGGWEVAAGGIAHRGPPA